MKYTKEQRLDIAKQVVNHDLTYKGAAEKYGVSFPCIANWVREYKSLHNLVLQKNIDITHSDYESLSSLSKDELIDEVIKARIGEERAKKGYEVKGGGQKKEYVSLYNKNTK